MERQAGCDARSARATDRRSQNQNSGTATIKVLVGLDKNNREMILMRALVLTSAILLVSSALYPASAIDAKTDVQSYEQKSTNENSDQKSTDQSSDNREVGRDWKMKPADGQTVGKTGGGTGQDGDDRQIDRDWQMRPRGDGNPRN
jgi:hypothetical protein